MAKNNRTHWIQAPVTHIKSSQITEPYRHNITTVQPSRSTRSLSLVILARPLTSFSLLTADSSFQCASSCPWNQLPALLRQPHSTLSISDSPVPTLATSCSFADSPLSPSVTPSLSFSAYLYLYQEILPTVVSTLRTRSTDYYLDRFSVLHSVGGPALFCSLASVVVCKARSTLATMSKQRSTLSKGQNFNAKLVRHCCRFWQTKSNVASTLLLVWTGLNTPWRRICNVTHQGAARDGGPVVLRLVRRQLIVYSSLTGLASRCRWRDYVLPMLLFKCRPCHSFDNGWTDC